MQVYEVALMTDLTNFIDELKIEISSKLCEYKKILYKVEADGVHT